MTPGAFFLTIGEATDDGLRIRAGITAAPSPIPPSKVPDSVSRQAERDQMLDNARSLAWKQFEESVGDRCSEDRVELGRRVRRDHLGEYLLIVRWLFREREGG